VILFCFFVFQTGPPYAALAGLKLETLLPRPLKPGYPAVDCFNGYVDEDGDLMHTVLETKE
jgi:hypothetical protein